MTTQIDSPAAAAPVSLPVAPERLHRLSLDQYHRMIAMGVFRKSDRLVLLDGLLVKKMTMGPRHFGTCRRIAKALAASLPAGWHERQDGPVTLPGGPAGFGSEPEPDVVVVSGTMEDYEVRHPGPEEIALVVQVAASSLADDRKALELFAFMAIPTVWIIDLNDDTIEVYGDPTGPDRAPRYQTLEIKKRGSTVSFPLRTRSQAIASARLIGPFPVDDFIPGKQS